MARTEKIYAIIKRSCEPVGRIIEISNTLEALQDAVEGRIQTVPVTENVTVLCDDDGIYNNKLYNCHIHGIDFVGTVLAVGVKGDDFDDVPITLDEWEDMINGKS